MLAIFAHVQGFTVYEDSSFFNLYFGCPVFVGGFISRDKTPLDPAVCLSRVIGPKVDLLISNMDSSLMIYGEN